MISLYSIYFGLKHSGPCFINEVGLVRAYWEYFLPETFANIFKHQCLKLGS